MDFVVVETDASNGACSQADIAYKRLESMLVTLRLPPNKLLTEDELSRMLDIGRTPVREAIKRLVFDGLLKVLPRKGIVVTPIEETHHLLLLEVRRELERLLAWRAAVHRTPAHASRFLALAEIMERAGESKDYETYLGADDEFNELMLVAAGSPPLRRIMASVHPAMRRFWYSHMRYLKDRIWLGGTEHAQVMYAVADGDPARAAQASDELMDYVEKVVQQVLPMGMVANSTENAR